METVWTVFEEAFLARLLPIFHEVTLAAERTFHPEFYPTHAVIAGVAALLAALVLFLLGVWLQRIPAKVSTPEQLARLEKMQAPARHWLPWLLILAPTPFGTALIIAAGFFRIRPVVAVMAIGAAEVLWRVSPYLG